MPAQALALVLTAAVLHATWNALAKRGLDPLRFLWSASLLGTLVYLPLAARPLARDGVPAAAAPYVVATVVLHALYFYTLARTYRSGDFSLVYPIARGFGVALVPVLALVLFDERPSALGAAGIGLVVVGAVGLQLAPARPNGLPRRRSPLAPGTWWALLTALLTAGYSLVDAAGVVRLHPLPYITLMFLGTTVLLLPVVLADGAALRREWRVNGRTILVASVLTVTAYLLVLFAFRLSKTGYVVAAREVSIVVSALLGSVWFKEGPLARRLAGAAVVLAGVTCVALAR